MSLVTEILTLLWETSLSYKGVRTNVFGIPKFKKYKDGSISRSLNRLSKKGLVANEDDRWRLTKYGKEYLKSSGAGLKKFHSPFKIKSPRNLIVMFDIPESMKKERGWLRSHLKRFDYIMIQKSVWVGPSPLPKEFISYLKEINIIDCIKKFKLANSYKETN